MTASEGTTNLEFLISSAVAEHSFRNMKGRPLSRLARIKKVNALRYVVFPTLQKFLTGASSRPVPPPAEGPGTAT